MLPQWYSMIDLKYFISFIAMKCNLLHHSISYIFLSNDDITSPMGMKVNSIIHQKKVRKFARELCLSLHILCYFSSSMMMINRSGKGLVILT